MFFDITLPGTNIAPEKDEFPFGDAPLFRDYISFRELYLILKWGSSYMSTSPGN